MKRNHFVDAFLISILAHLSIILFFWWITSNTKEKAPKPPREERFGISLSEEPFFDTPSKSQTSEKSIKKSVNPQPPSKTLQPSPLPDINKPAYTEKQREEIPFSILHHYGESFFTLPAGEQHYIIDNLQRIRKINEIVGTRLLRERLDEVDPSDNNIVTFTLYPDGTINDLTLEKNRVGSSLDELTIQTINLAYTKYPKPNQPTHIRIRVYILVK